ncbi:MAG: ribonuclease P protein component [Alphaproteobacteria bacterium]|nr:ribonuclease P protein component [Alphaproteobacteria bacterium]
MTRMSVGRLQHRADFLRVAGRGRRWVTPGLILQIAPTTPDADGAKARRLRVGFTVSRRVGNAVERNRVRRRLRAAVREVLVPHGREGCDYVVIGRRGSLARSYRDLVQDLETALVKLDAFMKLPKTNGTRH